MKQYDGVMPLIGRLLITLVFLASAATKIMYWNGSADLVATKLPMPSLMLGASAAVEILGSLCLLLGFQARIAAFIVFLYLLPTTFIFHDFWNMQDGLRADNKMHFLKNLAVMGGLLMVSAYGAGKWSIDALWSGVSKSGSSAPAKRPVR